MQVCPSCGFENVEGANFCANCGARLAGGEQAAAREERKVVSVVFADLVGSTARAERLDPEDVRAVLAPYHDRLRIELERFGGTVEKFIGDAVVGVFGAPVAHEDDPERAVRAALAIQQAIAELNEADEQLDLEVRIGVNTGEALVSLGARPEIGEAMVTGDVMNTAARLQSAAPPGGVLVSDATYRATSRTIEYAETDSIAAKGKTEPVAAWLAVSPRARFGVDVFQPGRAALVGRERELELVATALERVRAERQPQLVTLVGVPGIGKSRLISELAAVVEDDPDLIVWRQGRSLPYGQGIAFWAVGEIVKSQAGILESDDAANAGVKLAAALDGLLEGSEAEWVERHLRPLVGLAGGSAAGQDQQAEVFAAWRRFFEALAGTSPTVLVFEDLQWADDGVLDFVDGLVDRVPGVPLLVVCSARPELLERRPGWGGGKRNALTVSLSPLTEEDTARLVADLLDQRLLPAEEQALLLQRAEGNPLYAEEYARMLAEGDLRLAEVPETLHGLVAARIDALPGEEKMLLQQAAVLGKVFWTDALAALAEIDDWRLDELLHALERKEFVRREQRSAVALAKQYVFVHALVRDGAYGQMPRAVRATAHERAADWIESLPDDREEERAEVLAHHLVQAVEYGRATNRDVAELVPRGARALREAGDRAWRLGGPHRALPLFEQAATMHPEVAEDPHFLLRLGQARLYAVGEGERELAQAADALAAIDPTAAAEAETSRGERIWQGGNQEGAFRHFERAAALVEGAPPTRETLAVLAQLARFLVLAGRSREAYAYAERAIEFAEELSDDELLGDALNTRGLVRSDLGEDGWEDDLQRALEVALESNSWRAGRAYLNLGSQLLSLRADLRRAEALYREGFRYIEHIGHAYSARWFRGNLSECTYHVGLWDEALELAQEELANPEPHYMQQLCRMVRAAVSLARGATGLAREDVRKAVVDGHRIRDPQALIPALAAHAFVLATVGEEREEARALAELAATRGELESQAPGPWLLDYVFALLRLGREGELEGRGDELGPDTPWRAAALLAAQGDLVAAAESLHVIGARSLESYARLRAASRLSADGRHAEAAAQLERALAFYRDVGAEAMLREAEALRAAAS